MESDILNGCDDLGDLLRGGGDFFHGRIELLDVFHADAQLRAGLLHKLAGLPGGLGSPLGVSGDLIDGGGQLLHRAGLLGGPLGQGLGAVGYLLRTGGHLFSAGPDLAHGIVQLGLDAVQRVLDGSEIAHIVLLNAVGQVAVGDGVQHAGNLTDVGPQAVDGLPENLGQDAHLVVGVNADDNFLAVGQAQVALFQPIGNLGDLGQGGGHGFL